MILIIFVSEDVSSVSSWCWPTAVVAAVVNVNMGLVESLQKYS